MPRWTRWGLGLCCAGMILLFGLGAARYAIALTVPSPEIAADRMERKRAFTKRELPLPGTPDLANLEKRLADKGLKAGDPVFIRIFKAESTLELWMQRDEQFVLLDTYPICYWSGSLGPKLKEGDRQNPEGFYSVTARQLHASGRRWPRSLNIGFPNGLDRSLKRTGSYILIHGGCSSIGCFAMTNPVMEEIYSLTESALKAGQERVHIHAFPFRLTEANLSAHANSEWLPFWQELKVAHDAFEQSHLPPPVALCGQHYVLQAPAECEPTATAELYPSGDPPAELTARPVRTSHVMKLRARRGKLASRPNNKALLTKRAGKHHRVADACNPGLASCRKFMAMQQNKAEKQASARSRVASAGGGIRNR
jgi:murein L,D-transpeptidase YafK